GPAGVQRRRRDDRDEEVASPRFASLPLASSGCNFTRLGTNFPALMHAATAWKPAPEVTAHDGSAIKPEADFFVFPPSEIGPVTTAYSTLTQGKEPIPLPIRLAMFATAFLLPAAMIWWVFAEKHKADTENVVIVAAVLVWVAALL